MTKSLMLSVVSVCAWASLTFAQAPLPGPPPDSEGAPLPAPPQVAQSYPPQELDRIVSPIALYPDSLLGQILTAATFSPEIPPAAQWADEHHYVPPAELPSAIAADRLPWQPSVQALLPFPQVLDMMASSMPWTEELGAAFLASPEQVMDAVQRMRQSAYNFGYLRSNAQIVVRRGPFIEIVPVDPAFVVVPYYNPAVVFIAPRPGFFVGGAVRFGYGVRLGVAFAPWGWGTTRFGWGEHVLVVNNAPWHRTWVNRAVYVHPFVAVPRYAVAPRVAEHREEHREERREEHHEVRQRTAHEREAARNGRESHEEHRR
jgi:uncharacterized protein DUF3300